MRRVLLLIAAMAVMLFGLAVPAGAAGKGAVPLSALGFPAGPSECSDMGADLFILIEGSQDGWSLDGCVYQSFGSGHMTPSGAYQETGTETFVGELWYDGGFVGDGEFDTTYVFTGKFLGGAGPDGVPNTADDDFSKEIFGRCQHPIVAGTGTGVFEGATGRIDFKDVITERASDGTVLAAEFPMRGHIRLANGG